MTEQAQRREQNAQNSEVEDAAVSEAVRRLDGLAEAPPADHVEVYEDVHAVLQQALAGATDQPAPQQQHQSQE